MQPLAVRALHGRRVVTKNGTVLGTVRDLIIDADTTRVISFEVARRLIGGPVLSVPTDALIEIRPDVVVVTDTLVTDARPVLA